MTECKFGRRKAESLFVLRKNMYSRLIVSSLIHIPQFWIAVELMASRYGLQMLLTKESFLQQKSNWTNSTWSPYLDAIGSTANQNCGMWMRLDIIDLEYVLFHSTNKFSAFLLPNVYSAIAGSTNHIL
ncbi:hypothetical protein V6N13_122073 [Hibiscus sabdariffa]